MARNGLLCADVPLRNYSLTHSLTLRPSIPIGWRLRLLREIRLRFLWFSFTQRTQGKRLRLNGNRALVTVVVG